MTQEFIQKILNDYVKLIALSEVRFLKYNGREITEASSKQINYFYQGDESLHKKHIVFLKWMNSTMARFIISRTIVADYYSKIPCTLSSLAKQTQFTRNAITEVVKVSEDSEWIYRQNNKLNKSEMLIFPTDMRLKFWEIYCKVRFSYHLDQGMDNTYQMMKAVFTYVNKDDKLMVIQK